MKSGRSFTSIFKRNLLGDGSRHGSISLPEISLGQTALLLYFHMNQTYECISSFIEGETTLGLHAHGASHLSGRTAEHRVDGLLCWAQAAGPRADESQLANCSKYTARETSVTLLSTYTVLDIPKPSANSISTPKAPHEVIQHYYPGSLLAGETEAQERLCNCLKVT